MKEIVSELKETILNETTNLVTKTSKEFNNQTRNIEEKINKLENVNLQKEQLIFGLPNIKDETIIEGNNHEDSLMDLVCKHIKKDLNITLDRKAINFTYKLKTWTRGSTASIDKLWHLERAHNKKSIR